MWFVPMSIGSLLTPYFRIQHASQISLALVRTRPIYRLSCLHRARNRRFHPLVSTTEQFQILQKHCRVSIYFSIVHFFGYRPLVCERPWKSSFWILKYTVPIHDMKYATNAWIHQRFAANGVSSWRIVGDTIEPSDWQTLVRVSLPPSWCTFFSDFFESSACCTKLRRRRECTIQCTRSKCRIFQRLNIRAL